MPPRNRPLLASVIQLRTPAAVALETLRALAHPYPTRAEAVQAYRAHHAPFDLVTMRGTYAQSREAWDLHSELQRLVDEAPPAPVVATIVPVGPGRRRRRGAL